MRNSISTFTTNGQVRGRTKNGEIQGTFVSYALLIRGPRNSKCHSVYHPFLNRIILLAYSPQSFLVTPPLPQRDDVISGPRSPVYTAPRFLCEMGIQAAADIFHIFLCQKNDIMYGGDTNICLCYICCEIVFHNSLLYSEETTSGDLGRDMLSSRCGGEA